MTTIPEKSTLHWSTVKPTFEEVRGKLIDTLWIDGGGEVRHYDNRIMSQFDYDWMFDECFFCYAIIDADSFGKLLSVPDPDPLPLWGTNPRIRKTLLEDYFWAWTDEVTSFSKRGFEDEQAAVIDWNYFVEKVWGGEM